MAELKPTLLLVEDSPDDEFLSLRAISKCGVPCSVSVIRNGAEAVEFLMSIEGPNPDLVVLDFHLPGLSGLEVLRALRQNERTRDLPIVMLSATESEQEISQCLAEGANSFLLKPDRADAYMENVALTVRYWLTANLRPSTFGLERNLPSERLYDAP